MWKNGNMVSQVTRMAWMIGALVILIVMTSPREIDPMLLVLANFLGSPGNDIFLVLGNLLIIGWGRKHKVKNVLALALGSDLLVLVVVQGLKFLLTSEPWHLRPDGGFGGFPSGHATHGFVMAMLLTSFFPKQSWLWFLLAGSIAWSRVVTFWHFDVQVVAGVMLGVVLGSMLLRVWVESIADEEHTQSGRSYKQKRIPAFSRE